MPHQFLRTQMPRLSLRILLLLVQLQQNFVSRLLPYRRPFFSQFPSDRRPDLKPIFYLRLPLGLTPKLRVRSYRLRRLPHFFRVNLLTGDTRERPPQLVRPVKRVLSSTLLVSELFFRRVAKSNRPWLHLLDNP